ncbi:hypothetical protein [Streptosporangium sp. NPDC000396]|uniref:hypothetical protein n=1 Tax=Streptosporangium sp. NPDC000396 TaxID=3366185 RepID=UPI0036C64FBE
MNTKPETRMQVLERDVAVLRAESLEHKATSAAILVVLDDLRTITRELQKGQAELSVGQEELRAGQDELRAEIRAGQAELRGEIAIVKRSVGNLETSMKRVEGDVAELKAGHIELRNLVSGLIK